MAVGAVDVVVTWLLLQEAVAVMTTQASPTPRAGTMGRF
jgi:hypothetical protein